MVSKVGLDPTTPRSQLNQNQESDAQPTEQPSHPPNHSLWSMDIFEFIVSQLNLNLNFTGNININRFLERFLQKTNLISCRVCFSGFPVVHPLLFWFVGPDRLHSPHHQVPLDLHLTWCRQSVPGRVTACCGSSVCSFCPGGAPCPQPFEEYILNLKTPPLTSNLLLLCGHFGNLLGSHF